MIDYFQRILGLILLFWMYLWNVNYVSFGSIVLSEENLQKALSSEDTPLKVKSFPFYDVGTDNEFSHVTKRYFPQIWMETVSFNLFYFDPFEVALFQISPEGEKVPVIRRLQDNEGNFSPRSSATIAIPLQDLVISGNVNDILGATYDNSSNQNYSLSLFISICDNNQIYKIELTSEKAILVAGHYLGLSGYTEDGQSAFNNVISCPWGLASPSESQYLDVLFYFIEYGNRRLRSITNEGKLFTVLNFGAALFSPNYFVFKPTNEQDIIKLRSLLTFRLESDGQLKLVQRSWAEPDSHQTSKFRLADVSSVPSSQPTAQPSSAPTLRQATASLNNFCFCNGVGSCATAASCPAGQWCHMLYIKIGVKVRTYVNGVLKSTSTVNTKPMENGGKPLIFGGANTGWTNPASSVNYFYK
eukprot:gene16351-18538_t